MKIFLKKLFFIAFLLLVILAIFEKITPTLDISQTKFVKDYLKQNQNKIDGLIFGPSHIKRAINPQYLTANTASVALYGSSINVDYLLLKSILKSEKPKFILFDFSAGYPEKLNFYDWIKGNNLTYYFDLDMRYKLKDYFFTQYPLHKYFKKSHKTKEDFNKWGFELKIENRKNDFLNFNFDTTKIRNSEDAILTLKLHNSFNKKARKQNLEYLLEIAAICKSKNIKLIFLSPPKSFIYNESLLPEYHEYRTEFLKTLVDNKDVFFWDYSAFYQKNIDSFYNINHLNPKGAELFTKEINARLKQMNL
jgi:hypothetical protein